jgi:hypothetical protein
MAELRADALLDNARMMADLAARLNNDGSRSVQRERRDRCIVMSLPFHT